VNDTAIEKDTIDSQEICWFASILHR